MEDQTAVPAVPRQKRKYTRRKPLKTRKPITPKLKPAVEVWDVTLQIPEDRAVDIFANFTIQEQFDAIAHVLRGRMEAILEAA